MKLLVIICVFILPLSCKVIPKNEDITQSKSLTYNLDCPDGTFLYCQHAFNKALGISTDLTWQNVTQIQTIVDNFMLTNQAQYIQGCQQRQIFYSCLGAKYSNCINRYHLLTKATDQSLVLPAYLYAAFWNGFDFQCNGGWTTAIYSPETFNQDSLHKDILQCQNNFLNSMANSISSICVNTNAYMTCMQNFYITATNKRIGWFACEKARTQFAEDCPDLRCQVLD
uniref:DUF19 domain-containing protein n=1 Tax=Parastrongyloides trichosuri TaxID=131310 RepID=A0A0N4Z0U0_PARTI